MERISTNESVITTPTETCTLGEIVRSSKRTGGNYGSLAKSQLQPTFYISHQVESDDTLQRLALKYSINIQEIKRINKLWSDAELNLFEYVYIPVNSTQLITLQKIYPELNIIQDLSSIKAHRKSSMNSMTSNETISSSPTTNNSSYKDYFSKIDQQIRLTKNSLQSLDNKTQYTNSKSHDTSTSNSSENNSPITISNRHKGVHHLHDNSVFVNIKTQNSREKHLATALKRLQQEQDNFDEL